MDFQDNKTWQDKRPLVEDSSLHVQSVDKNLRYQVYQDGE